MDLYISYKNCTNIHESSHIENIYLFNPLQDVTQGQFLSSVQLFRIQNFPSPDCLPKKPSLPYYLHMYLGRREETDSHLLNLNSVHQFHFLK